MSSKYDESVEEPGDVEHPSSGTRKRNRLRGGRTKEMPTTVGRAGDRAKGTELMAMAMMPQSMAMLDALHLR